jgi:hypothetical protein
MGGAHRATAIGFVSAFSRLPVHPANTKANNRAMILIRAIPFCQVSKQGIRREGSPENGGWQYPSEGGLCVSASTKLKRPQTFSPCGLRVKN